MNAVDQSSPGVVALLLDDLTPPRLGTLLRGARKANGSTRREVAHRVGTSTSELRRYERGEAAVPASMVAALAECYGEDLTAQLATRAPVSLDDRRLVVGGVEQTLASDDSDEVLQHYVGIVARLRNTQPGEPIALRADDLVALSSALGLDTDRVEARIVELLGCTRPEAHSLHAEMLRRKLVVPVAGLVAGLAMVAGVGVANAAPSTPTAPAAHATAAATAPAPVGVGHVAAAHIAAAHIAAGHVVTAVVAPAPTTVVVKPPVTESTDPAPSTPPAAAPETEEHATMPRPVVPPDNTPMSIPDNETVTIIAP